MRVMVLVKANENSEQGIFPAPELQEAMHRFNEELIKAGVRRAADGLKPSSLGKRIAIDGDSRRVIDGPFAEVRELVSGYWVWEVKDMEEAMAWAKRCPNPLPGPSEIEIRPMYEMADFK
jgi:hypothetical protein